MCMDAAPHAHRVALLVFIRVQWRLFIVVLIRLYCFEIDFDNSKWSRLPRSALIGVHWWLEIQPPQAESVCHCCKLTKRIVFSTVSCPTIEKLIGIVRILNHKITEDLRDLSEQVPLISGG